MAPYKWNKRKCRHMPKYRRRLSISHPSIGGTRGYSVDFRQSASRVRRQGRENDPLITQMRDNIEWPCTKTTYNWDERIQLLDITHRFQ